ncbi:unnamed protein product [Toxocara canis]|uniref:Secreted protein n=1 Tax=Toxocara canis TaxID=6265 RepID=A0A183UBR3_TOXCA|nr:unnamed protein product [Toxocara canis]
MIGKLILIQELPQLVALTTGEVQHHSLLTATFTALLPCEDDDVCDAASDSFDSLLDNVDPSVELLPVVETEMF